MKPTKPYSTKNVQMFIKATLMTDTYRIEEEQNSKAQDEPTKPEKTSPIEKKIKKKDQINLSIEKSLDTKDQHTVKYGKTISKQGTTHTDLEEKKVELAILSKKERDIARQNYEAACAAAQKAREERIARETKEKQALLERERCERAEQIRKAKEELDKKEAGQKEMRKRLYEQALAKAEEEKVAREKRLALKRKREEEWAKRLQKDRLIQEKKLPLKQEAKGSNNSYKQNSQAPSIANSHTKLPSTPSNSQAPAINYSPPKELTSLSNLQVVKLELPNNVTSKPSCISTSPEENTSSSHTEIQQSFADQSYARLLQSLTYEQSKLASSQRDHKSPSPKRKNSLRNAIRKIRPQKSLLKSLPESSVDPATPSSDDKGRLKSHRWPKYRKNNLDFL